MNAILNLIKGMSAKDWGSLLSGGAAAYGAYRQGKIANSLAKLQLQDYDEEKKRKKKTQGYIDSAFSAKLPLTTR